MQAQTIDEQYMKRCLHLAVPGLGNVAPNPMVGAVLVYENTIIGEGYHKEYGKPHAEVNCINNVKNAHKHLIPQSILYVSLEPCSHYGKTPPCTNLIIESKIKKVVIGCPDIYKEVAGKGIEKLQNAGVAVVTGVLEKECKEINKRFFTFHKLFRPYIILKWAQSINNKIGSKDGKRIFITNEYTNRIVHKWRSEEAAILIGTNTALKDNALLTTRLWTGKNPVRIVIDKHLHLSRDLHVFNKDAKTIIYNLIKSSIEDTVVFIKINKDDFMGEMLQSLFETNMQSIIVEGGLQTLQSFIDAGLWDEARVITNEDMIIENGMNAPEMKNFLHTKKENYTGNLINYYTNDHAVSSASVTSSAGN